MSKFSVMRDQRAAKAAIVAPTTGAQEAGSKPTAIRPPARQGKKAVSAYFSADVSRGLNILAAENGTTLQALLGEAIDLLMRQHGKHPFGER